MKASENTTAKAHRHTCRTCDAAACCRHTFGAYWDAKSSHGAGCNHKIAPFDLAVLNAAPDGVGTCADSSAPASPAGVRKGARKLSRTDIAARLHRMTS